MDDDVEEEDEDDEEDEEEDDEEEEDDDEEDDDLDRCFDEVLPEEDPGSADDCLELEDFFMVSSDKAEDEEDTFCNRVLAAREDPGKTEEEEDPGCDRVLVAREDPGSWED